VGTAVVGRCDGAETLLASGIPLQLLLATAIPSSSGSAYNLQLDGLAIEFNSADFLRHVSLSRADRRRICGCTHEVDTDGRNVALCVCVVCETEKQAGLSDTGVSDQEQLEEVVVSGRARCQRGAPRAGRAAPTLWRYVGAEGTLWVAG
jgi:hypothetical protein